MAFPDSGGNKKLCKLAEHGWEGVKDVYVQSTMYDVYLFVGLHVLFIPSP